MNIIQTAAMVACTAVTAAAVLSSRRGCVALDQAYALGYDLGYEKGHRAAQEETA